MKYPINGFETPTHAYAAGAFMGVAAKQGIKMVPVLEGGSWTNRFEVIDDALPEGVRVFVAVEPPIKKETIHGFD